MNANARTYILVQDETERAILESKIPEGTKLFCHNYAQNSPKHCPRVCRREKGHDGPHAAFLNRRILAVWS